MLPSCMAFAVAVIQGQKTLADCPHLDSEIIESLSPDSGQRKSLGSDPDQALHRFREEIAGIDLQEAARRLNAPYKDGMIVINSLGKDFMVDATGDLVSECHKNPWVHVPILQYILHCKGVPVKGDWVAFNELQGAAEWNRFFSHRCEIEMHKLADAHQDIFFEILNLFGAEEVHGVTNSDQSLVLYPLPGVPFLFNYWQPEESFDSKLNILFDRTAEENIDLQSMYVLGRGLVEMFRQLIVKHSRDGKLF